MPGGLSGHGFPGCRQLQAGPPCEALRAYVFEELVCGTQAGARIPRALGTSQPFAVDEVAAGKVGGSPGVAVLVYGLLVIVFCAGTVACDEGLGPGEEPECDRAGIGGGQLGQPVDQVPGGVAVAGALGCLDEIGQGELDLRCVVDAGCEAGVSGVIAAVSELEDAAGIVGEDELVSLALPVGLVGNRVQQGIGLLGLSAPRREEQ